MRCPRRRLRPRRKTQYISGNVRIMSESVQRIARARGVVYGSALVPTFRRSGGFSHADVIPYDTCRWEMEFYFAFSKVVMMAQLGGYLNRKHDGPPGPQAIWIGLQRTRDFAPARSVFSASNTPPCCVFHWLSNNAFRTMRLRISLRPAVARCLCHGWRRCLRHGWRGCLCHRWEGGRLINI
jgi:hypothetical protein